MPGRPKSRAKPASKANRKETAADPEQFRITHPDRVLYKDEGITKRDLAEYYVHVADWMLPQLVDRPLTLVRCPEGTSGACFYQKHPPMGMPSFVDRVSIQERDGTATYLAVHDLAGLIALVQFGALEIHVWGSKVDNPERPDRMVFDLDPDVGLPWSEVKSAAVSLRKLLEGLGLETFVKTTGGKGLHIVAPLARKHTWAEVKQFSKAVADAMVAAAPGRFLATMSKAARRGKIFVDYLRNDSGSTSIVAYSSRARAGATVSMPIDWSELRSLDSPQKFTVLNAPQRLKKLKRDPWADMAKVRQSITASAKKKLGLR